MLLSGDDLTAIPADRLAMLQKLLPPTGVAATFEDDSLTVGTSELSGNRIIYFFVEVVGNLQQHFRQRAGLLADVESGESPGRHEGVFTMRDMPAIRQGFWSVTEVSPFSKPVIEPHGTHADIDR
jgi:hypothetical protein